MKLMLISLLFLAGCATSAVVSLPLHEKKIDIPRYISRQSRPDYIKGYQEGWLATLRIFAKDIDHRWTEQESVFVGSFDESDAGWGTGRGDADQMIQNLISTLGKVQAKAKLAEAIAMQPEPNHTSLPIRPAVTPRAAARVAPADLLAGL